jgi:signal transduction histidine kinase
MDPGATGVSPSTARDDTHGSQEPEGNRALRTVLLLSFGGLLLFLLYSGISALKTMGTLHDAEESGRTRLLERRRVLSTAILSVDLYSNHMEAFLLNSGPAEEGAAEEVRKRVDAARVVLQTYPPDRSSEEQSLIEQLETLLAEQDSVFRSIQPWKPEEHSSHAQRIVNEEIIPRRQRIVAVAQKIELLNDGQTAAANVAIFQQFGRLQDRLMRLLVLTLASGFLLAVGSAIFILRLERQARQRYAELAHNRRELQELSARLVDAQETERRAISRELHDEVGQALGLLLIDAGQLSNQLASGDDRGKELIQRIKGVAESTVKTVRNMALLLRPSMLDDLGLVSAVEWYAREMSRRGELDVEVQADDVPEHLPDELKVCVYRLVQEALNNAQRHAHAKSVLVRLRGASSTIRVEIADQGSGFDPRHTRGMGLLGMEERVKRLGGRITVNSRPGEGTIILAELPLTIEGASKNHEENTNPAC